MPKGPVVPQVARPMGLDLRPVHGLCINGDAGHTMATRTLGGRRYDYCPECGIWALLDPIPDEVRMEGGLTTHGFLTTVREGDPDGMRCHLCLIAVDWRQRYFAVLRGYIWYLIGTRDCADQASINRSLWNAAIPKLRSQREARRAGLRAHLAVKGKAKEFREASDALSATDRDRAKDHLRAMLGSNYQRISDTYESAILGSLGMHQLLREVEQTRLQKETTTPVPDWLGRERYFLTDLGHARLAEGLPLGYEPEPTTWPNGEDMEHNIAG